jgi:ABC-type uncharacterized transport system permease subunit
LYGIAPPWRLELLWFPVSVLLGVGISSAIWFIAYSGSFWRESANSELAAVTFVTAFLGGVFVPIDFYPDAMKLAADALPFRGMLYTPVAIFAGKLEGAALAFGLLHQVTWFALLSWLARALESRGLRKLAVHGG